MCGIKVDSPYFMANILTYGFYAKLIFKNSIKSSLVYSLVLAIGLLGDAAFALDAPFVDNASNVDHSLMHTVTNSFEATDPCSCNNDQSFNGAQDGTFSETISITNTAPGFL